ncbi:hypothetical protein B0H11DRAFT_2188099 [Mycena galericulata]|nr:hypothetical protein B0H11DRAFT_2188099 [Mycena galericulata]
MSSPPAKRQRAENAPIMRSNIWHDDGSVVLQAGDMQFRVHWSVLSLNSSFFRDMKGLPQPPDQPSVEGCPIVELSDAVEDVEYLLKALYSPTFLMQKTLPFPAVAALIRLGRKYNFREVLDTTVERITFENPTTLDEYVALGENEEYTPTRIAHSAGILYDVLTLARENDILSALPCAYYRVMNSRDQAQMFTGIPRGDGTSATLCPLDLQRCVLGRQKLMQDQWKAGYTLNWLTRGDGRCTDIQRCSESRQALLVLLMTNGWLGALLSPSMLVTFDVNLCKKCSGHRVRIDDRGPEANVGGIAQFS